MRAASNIDLLQSVFYYIFMTPSIRSGSCPACGSSRYKVIDKILRRAICDGYLQALSMDISSQFDEGIDSIKLLHCLQCDLRWFSPAVAGDDRFYELLQRHDWYYQDEKPEYRNVGDRLPDRGTLLEVGCGKGAFANFVPPSMTYRGLEFNNLAVSAATTSGLEVERKSIQQEASERPGHYDVVCHFQVLEHVPDIAGFMRACVDTLRPGGRLFATVPAHDSFLALVSAGWLNMPPHHVSLWSDQSLLNLAAGLGLYEAEVVHEPVADYHRNWYESVMREHYIRRIIGGQWSLASTTPATIWARRSRYLSGLANWLLKKGEDGFEFAGRGHSVLLIASKR